MGKIALRGDAAVEGCKNRWFLQITGETNMPAKMVLVEVCQGGAFKTECTAGKHTVVVDQPMAAGGTDEGPTPLDYQLISLGGCIASRRPHHR